MSVPISARIARGMTLPPCFIRVRTGRHSVFARKGVFRLMLEKFIVVVGSLDNDAPYVLARLVCHVEVITSTHNRVRVASFKVHQIRRSVVRLTLHEEACSVVWCRYLKKMSLLVHIFFLFFHRAIAALRARSFFCCAVSRAADALPPSAPRFCAAVFFVI